MDTPFWTLAVLAALSITALVWGLHELWQQHLNPRHARLAQRLTSAVPKDATAAATDAPALQLRPRRLLSSWAWADRVLQQVPGAQAFDRCLLQTGWSIGLSHALSWAAGLVLLAVLLGVLLGWTATLTALVAAMALVLFMSFLQHLRNQRMALIGQALPDALDLMARSMLAGHAFTSALQVAAKEGAPPLSHELRAVFEEINFGVGTTQALQALSARVASEDVHYFVVAVVVQNETGGNLAEVLQNTAQLIRERQKIAGVVRVLSSEGRISAVILSVLPFALAAVMSGLNPGFISKLWQDPMGLQLVYVSLVLMGLGIVWMWKLIQIRV